MINKKVEKLKGLRRCLRASENEILIYEADYVVTMSFMKIDL